MRFNRTALLHTCSSTIAVILFMLIGSAPGIIMAGSAAKLDTQQSEPLHLKLVLERIYLDGEISEEVVQENIHSLEDIGAKYDQWQLKKVMGSKIIFTKQMDDISPLLKANGYFGITRQGILSIYNGKPDQSKIIQSFFQIDINKLESHIQQELHDGIPIKTKDNYVKVLETFKLYSTDGN